MIRKSSGFKFYVWGCDRISCRRSVSSRIGSWPLGRDNSWTFIDVLRVIFCNIAFSWRLGDSVTLAKSGSWLWNRVGCVSLALGRNYSWSLAVISLPLGCVGLPLSGNDSWGLCSSVCLALAWNYSWSLSGVGLALCGVSLALSRHDSWGLSGCVGLALCTCVSRNFSGGVGDLIGTHSKTFFYIFAVQKLKWSQAYFYKNWWTGEFFSHVQHSTYSRLTWNFGRQPSTYLNPKCYSRLEPPIKNFSQSDKIPFCGEIHLNSNLIKLWR